MLRRSSQTSLLFSCRHLFVLPSRVIIRRGRHVVVANWRKGYADGRMLRVIMQEHAAIVAESRRSSLRCRAEAMTNASDNP